MTQNEAIQDFVRRAGWFAEIMAWAGAPIRWHSYFRSGQEQEELFRKGATKARAGQSAHNYGLAADYHFQDHGWNVPDSWWEYGDMVARYVGLTTGKSYGDANHIEYGGWKIWKT